ncbi:hypothetical protein [Methylobacterium sp. J-092]|uniref:hypothetical protein n=1 Tax=Methylobacterium sp. J-092 TaxID=2836667 RepID=UPI001FBAA65C|nr:hypothetical protein [Methylobacterium sp. J-092]MCJ2009905.1 hypothetical protein [Methylobacterium sp. J-092]
MRELLARVKAAEGPDRRLDYEIFTAFATPGEANPWDPAAGHFYTASIDAAVALAGRVLPGTMWAVGEMEGGPFCRLVYPKSDGFREAVSMEQDGGPDSAPLAICAALLTALIAAEDQAPAIPAQAAGGGDA